MHLKDFSPSSLVISLFIFILSHMVAFPKYVWGIDFRYAACNSSVKCGKLGNIQYPFWVNGSQPQYCGHPYFGLDCLKYEAFLWSERFRVLELNSRNQTLKIARFNDPSTGRISCPLSNISKDSITTLISYFSDVTMIRVLHDCPPIKDLSSYGYRCNNQSHSYFVANESLANKFISSCGYNLLLPVPRSAAEGLRNRSLRVGEALGKEYELKYWTPNDAHCEECMESGGRCGYDWNFNTLSCFCRDKPHRQTCSSKSTNVSKKIMAIMAAAAGTLFFSILIIFPFRRKISKYGQMFIRRKSFDADQNIEEFFRNYGKQAPKRYSYSDIKKMTNSFKDKIGQGGYGGVYKGKFDDGSFVAVKVLNPTKGNGEEFINEVASISRTSHVNIVRLLGFCFESGKKALIYEFMSNGSLENFLCSESTPLKANKHLGWEKLYQIAIGIARGLDYLHCGCRTKILHFDVKPHNILLDQDFSPKISDFGLAKLCPPKESIISMSVARGTIGYVAPEVFSRNFGRVSHKSDVYSYGMMLLEMVGGRQNVNGTMDNTSDTYFPHWIYKNLERQEDLGLEGIENKGENEITRKMIVVGLWCIQTDPSHRPCMSKVIEMLEGSIEALQIPPKPFSSSPPRFPLESSSFNSTSSQ